MRKRERENPCGICGHYHKYEEGEVCGVCGHRMPPGGEERPPFKQDSAFPSEILRDFLFLGSYDNASRSELLKTIGISHILNTVAACQNLYKNSFTYFVLQDDQNLRFDDAIGFIEQCEKIKARVLVHCMSGKSRSAAVVIAYLMKAKGWRLAQSFQWVKERRPQINLSSGAQQQLVEYEQQLFGPSTTAATAGATPFEQQPFVPAGTFPSLGFGFPKPPDSVPVPAFSQESAPSIFDRTEGSNGLPAEFTFGASRHPTETNTGNGTSMDSS
ncbi:hypothetical protein LUZ62_030260 [Rhynchospora pubera]|uniref:Protein-tyrosine-phosphatase n=1 Tax=Rhynchospora pubera TaxID=906938 RepID=A0AAV8HJP1_9POAL|nr:hypothetical protein LUZ62_030260 [Rhynchospora pubera]